MEQLDFKAITSDAVDTIGSMTFERPRRFYCGPVTILDATPETVRDLLISSVFEKGIAQLNERHPAMETLVAEKALASLIRRGVFQSKVIFRKNSFRLKLKNGKYRVYKGRADGTASACPWTQSMHETRYAIHIPGELLAEFIVRFDAEIPTIVAHVPEVLEALTNKQLEAKRRQKEKDLKNKVIQTLIDEYLKPRGISVRSKFIEEDLVSVDISQEFFAQLKLPFSQLVDKLKDPDTIVASLKVREPSDVPLNEEELFFP